MSKPVELKITGNEADAMRAIAALERKYDSLEQKVRRGNQAAKDGAKTGTDALSLQEKAVDSLISKYVSFATAIEGVAKEYENMRERGKTALDTQMNLQGAIEALAINTMGFQNFPLDKALGEADRITQQRGVRGGRETVMRAMSEAFNALGSLTPQEGVRAVDTTMKLIPNMPLAHADVAAGILDIRNRRPDWSEEQAAGFMMTGMMHTRVASLQAFAQNAMPGILNMASLDNNDILGNAPILNALTHGSVDKFGRTSRTAGMALAMQMREFVGREESAGLSNAQLIDMFQNDEQARKAFLYGGEHKGKKRFGLQHEIVGPDGEKYLMGDDRASFEKKAFASVEQLLTPGSAVDKAYRRFQSEMGDQQKQGRQFEAVNQAIDTLPGGQVVQAANRGQALVQGLQLGNTTDSRWAASRGILGESLKAAGATWIDQFMVQRKMDVAYGMGYEPEDAAHKIARSINKSYLEGSGGSETWGSGAATTAAKLQELVDLTKLLVDERMQNQPPLDRNGQGGN